MSRPADQDDAYGRALRRAGFLPVRTETLWRLPVAAIPTIPVRAGHELVSVTELAPEDVAVLDNAIREDIPGTSGWQGTGAQLAESLDDPDFDPAMYLIARHPRTGSLDGLVRVWNRHPQPRLGCIGVTSPWRRTSLALGRVSQFHATSRSRRALRGIMHVMGVGVVHDASPFSRSLRSLSKSWARWVWPLAWASSCWAWRVGRKAMVVWKKVQVSQMDSKAQSEVPPGA